ncbi:MAG TPA: hypothetical protein VFS00_28730, partial [Polyangiaceae bacterium]|nr:hypothetical protein [Polyangiaceae bacterium]
RAVVAVVSDHGFAEVDAEVNLKSALREAGLVERDAQGRVTSWRASAWVAGATAAIVLRDPGDGDAERRAGELVRRLSEGPDAVVARTLRPPECAALGGFPTASFVITLRPGHYFGNSPYGPLVVRRDRPEAPGYRGMHGFLPDEPAMRAAFFLVGPRVPAGRSLGAIDLRDVAPTLAALLGVGLPSAEGRNLLAGAAPPLAN